VIAVSPGKRTRLRRRWRIAGPAGLQPRRRSPRQA
jgi:hypothetical protein